MSDDPNKAPYILAKRRYMSASASKRDSATVEQREAEAFYAGWDAHIDFRKERSELQAHGNGGCAVPLIVMSGLVGFTLLVGLATALFKGLDVALVRVLVGLLLAGLGVMIGRALLKGDRADYADARKLFVDRWGGV